jgi:hypothetical protein
MRRRRAIARLRAASSPPTIFPTFLLAASSLRLTIRPPSSYRQLMESPSAVRRTSTDEHGPFVVEERVPVAEIVGLATSLVVLAIGVERLLIGARVYVDPWFLAVVVIALWRAARRLVLKRNWRLPSAPRSAAYAEAAVHRRVFRRSRAIGRAALRRTRGPRRASDEQCRRVVLVSRDATGSAHPARAWL